MFFSRKVLLRAKNRLNKLYKLGKKVINDSINNKVLPHPIPKMKGLEWLEITNILTETPI